MSLNEITKGNPNKNPGAANPHTINAAIPRNKSLEMTDILVLSYGEIAIVAPNGLRVNT